MNRRNVKALTDVLIALKWDDYGLDPVDVMARRLARKGVLVPSALYPQECMDAIREAADVEEIDISVVAFRDALERIAKGKPND